MVWTVCEIALNLFEGFLFTWFVTKMLTKKRTEYISTICYAVLTAAALSLFTWFDMPMWSPWAFVFIVLYSVFFFKGALIQRLFWSSIPIVLSMSLTDILIYVSAGFLRSGMINLLTPGFPRIALTLTSDLLFFAVLFLITKLFPEKESSEKPSYLLLIIVFLCVFLIDLFVRTRYIYQLPMSSLLPGCVITMMIVIVTIVTHRVLTYYTNREQQLLFLNQQIKDQQTQMELLQETYKTTLQLRHDVKAYVNDVEEMVNRGELQAHPEYLRQLENRTAPAYSTGNLALDSILPVKVQKITALGIEFRGSGLHYTGSMNIDDLALCSLVSNMLDNATEALTERKDQKGERYISLEFIYNRSGLMILCENPLLGVQPKMQHSVFPSIKAEPWHGLGISIMERITHDAGGQLDIVLSDDLFRVLALIPPKKNAETAADGEHGQESG